MGKDARAALFLLHERFRKGSFWAKYICSLIKEVTYVTLYGCMLTFDASAVPANELER